MGKYCGESTSVLRSPSRLNKQRDKDHGQWYWSWLFHRYTRQGNRVCMPNPGSVTRSRTPISSFDLSIKDRSLRLQDQTRDIRVKLVTPSCSWVREFQGNSLELGRVRFVHLTTTCTGSFPQGSVRMSHEVRRLLGRRSTEYPQDPQ